MPHALPFPLTPARAHEAQGPGAPFFAIAACAVQPKPCLWIAERWQAEGLNPYGVAEFMDPAHLLLAHTPNQLESLASAEEALRSGAFGVVVTRLSEPLTLFTGRRLLLAAQAGESLGVFLIPEGAGSPAAETRWHCAPHFSAKDSTLHHWRLIKNKSGTLTEWVIRWDEQARGISVVSEAPE
jgi:protein ImuA